MAITIVYYDYDSLLRRVKEMHEKSKSDTLVLMCRGSSPSSGEVTEILKEKAIEINNYIPLRLPCAGRVPAEFVFKVLNAGIRRIVSIQCEDNFCRFKEGSKISTRRLLLTQKLFEYIGLGKGAFTVIKYARKAVYDTEKCVGCDKCVFICPYNAIKAEPFSTPTIVYEDCVGCGACALVCPHKAIEVKGYEFDEVLQRYGQAAAAMKTQGKAPAVLVFSCQWSEFSALDDPESVLKGKNAVVLEVPCFKGMDPVHVVNALQCGFDGVMGVVCAADDCKLSEGRDTAERNLGVLKDVLKKMNLLERFELFELSPRCEGEFKSKFGGFYQKIAALPQCVVVKKEAEAKRTK